ncbi:MAG TPA: proline--tRNA ligase, partial [Planctomycetota bacterium]|nr:proline--tRNA ligase [Planctomycetota bacterium]
KNSRVIDTMEDYEKFFKDGGGFAWVHWAGDKAGEEEMAKRFRTSIRNIPLEGQGPAGSEGAGKCILTGKPSTQRVVMSEAY